MPLPRRAVLHASLLMPGLLLPDLVRAQAGTADADDRDLRALLAERLRFEGLGLAAARVGPAGSLQMVAEGRSGQGQDLLDPARHTFEIGSITKTFTGLLLADAVVRGELKLDDAAESLLPDGLSLRDRDGQPLRLIDLATHRSGLPRLPTPFAPKNAADPYADFGEVELRAALRAFKPQYRRDERFEYSNFGMGLLGWLLAQRAGQPLAALLQERVLGPLGLSGLGSAGGADGMRLQQAPLNGLNLARGHGPTGQAVPAWHFQDALAGAGALRASAAHMARYAQAALGLVPHPLGEAFALALRPHSDLGPQTGVRMGLAWMLLERAGERLATHDGGTGGFSSSLWLNLSQGRGGLALANAQVPVTDLALHLMDKRSPLRDLVDERRRRKALQEQASAPLDAGQLAPLAGVYALSPQFKVTVRAEAARLFAQATGQAEFELFARSARQFFARVAPLEIHFDGEQGPAAAFTLLQGGQKLRFVRE